MPRIIPRLPNHDAALPTNGLAKNAIAKLIQMTPNPPAMVLNPAMGRLTRQTNKAATKAMNMFTRVITINVGKSITIVNTANEMLPKSLPGIPDFK